MDKIGTDIQKLYNQTSEAPYANWKKEERFPSFEALDVWKNVKRLFLHEKQSSFVFVSPTANYPTHEIEIFRSEAFERKGHVTFLVGDIADLNPKVEISQIKRLLGEKNKFIYFKWDARNIPVKEDTVDAIWDRRGWIWYCAKLLENRETIESLQRYHKILKKGGVVILDADHDQGANKYGHSTDEVVRLMVDENFWDNEEIKNMFDIHNVGEGLKRVLVLVKK